MIYVFQIKTFRLYLTRVAICKRGLVENYRQKRSSPGALSITRPAARARGLEVKSRTQASGQSVAHGVRREITTLREDHYLKEQETNEESAIKFQEIILDFDQVIVERTVV